MLTDPVSLFTRWTSPEMSWIFLDIFGWFLSELECEKYETELLDFYFEELAIASRDKISAAEFHKLEQEWRKMYPIASSDFTRFLLGWMPSHEKLNGYSLGLVERVLAGLK